MENLNKSQGLCQRWASLPSFSGQAVIIFLGVAAALFPLSEAQAQVRQNGAETKSKIEAPDLREQAQGPSGSSETELNLPPLEQSLITGERQDTTQSPEISPHLTELDDPLPNPDNNKQNPIGAPETPSPFSETPLAPVAPTPNSPEPKNLRTWLTPGAPEPSRDLLTQAPAVPEEGLEPAELEEAPAVEESSGGEEPLEVDAASESEGTPSELEPEEAAEPGESSEAREYVYGRNGQGRWFVQTGIAIPYNPDESNFYGLAGAGITHFFASGHSINVSLNGLAFNQEGSDSVGINLDVIARWHFIRRPTWSLFIDGGVGFLNTTSRVPLIGGSRFNFTPQVGGGASLRVKNKTRLLMGIRWHHISNANLFEPNVGQDAVLGWVGLELPR